MMKKNALKSFLWITANGILICYLFSACSPGKSSDKDISGTVSISGAFALYPMAVKWAEEFQKIHPGVRVDVSAGGAGKGMTDALTKMVDLGMVSRAVSEEEVAKGAWYIAVTRDAVLPTVNTRNPFMDSIRVHGLTKAQFEGIFISGTIQDWKQCYKVDKGEKISVYTRSDACGAAEMWAKFFGKKQENLIGVGVFGDPGIADAVKADAMGIGYNNVIYAYDINSRNLYPGMAVVPIDQDGNRIIDPVENCYQNLDSIMSAIQTGRYPSPPARDLYFVSKGKPHGNAAIEFLRWILNEGQAFVKEAGYVQLTPAKIRDELKKLE